MSDKLTDKQLSFLKLVKRSKKVDGWSQVSRALTSLVKEMNIPTLTEIKDRDGVTWVRLTEEGETIVKWV